MVQTKAKFQKIPVSSLDNAPLGAGYTQQSLFTGLIGTGAIDNATGEGLLVGGYVQVDFALADTDAVVGARLIVLRLTEDDGAPVINTEALLMEELYDRQSEWMWISSAMAGRAQSNALRFDIRAERSFEAGQRLYVGVIWYASAPVNVVRSLTGQLHFVRAT